MVGGQPPDNVRRVGEKHNIVKQADSNLGVRCSGNSRGNPCSLIPTFAFCQASFLMTFATGGIPHSGSRRAGKLCGSSLGQLSDLEQVHSIVSLEGNG